jgi:hypothetical protein
MKRLEPGAYDGSVKAALAGKPVRDFRGMVEEYFQLAINRRPTNLQRRPLVAFRFEWEYLWTIRPGWSPGKWVRQPLVIGQHVSEWVRQREPGKVFPERLLIEGRLSDSRHQVLGLKITPDEIKWTRWSYDHGEDAIKMFAELVEHFVWNPGDVFRRSSTHCCCCGKAFSDHLSMARGIGPDCIKWFQPWLDRRCAAAESLAVQREEYLAETGFSK